MMACSVYSCSHATGYDNISLGKTTGKCSCRVTTGAGGIAAAHHGYLQFGQAVRITFYEQQRRRLGNLLQQHGVVTVLNRQEMMVRV
jgi:hypothetical protein